MNMFVLVATTTIGVTGETSGVLGNFIYQWYASTNNVDFMPVADANAANFNNSSINRRYLFLLIQ